MIRNILFDMGNVLKRFSPPQLISRFELPEEEQKLLLREVFRETEWVALDAGAITEAEAVKRICKRVPSHLHEAVRWLVEDWWKAPFETVDGMEELIENLYQNGYHIYLLSNANIRQKEYFHKLPAYTRFEGRITSAEEHLIKPQKEIYELILSRYGLKREECVFIDDSPANVFMAEQCGIHGIVFHDDMELLKKRLAALEIRTDRL